MHACFRAPQVQVRLDMCKCTSRKSGLGQPSWIEDRVPGTYPQFLEAAACIAQPGLLSLEVQESHHTVIKEFVTSKRARLASRVLVLRSSESGVSERTVRRGRTLARVGIIGAG